MQAAPAVSVRCGHSPGWRSLQAALAGLAAAALGTWALQLRQLALWPAPLLATGAAAWAWRLARPQPTSLDWDGQRWRCDGRDGEVDLMIDLGPWMLLRWRPSQPGERRIWLPLGAAAAGARLHALRAAVYCRTPQPAADVRPVDHRPALKSD